MDGIIINELSLSGQFHDSQDFWKNGMPPFYKALQDARSFGVGVSVQTRKFLRGHKPLPTRLFMIC